MHLHYLRSWCRRLYRCYRRLLIYLGSLRKESTQFAKTEKQSLKKLESSLKLYAPDSAPALAIKATMEKTMRR
ncbi:putative photosystem I PsaF, reaction centre subunit III [Helianthus annuus]|nr:putative photosystem I PsaF, reaction centre subunit III [Helianthus annuus]